LQKEAYLEVFIPLIQKLNTSLFKFLDLISTVNDENSIESFDEMQIIDRKYIDEEVIVDSLVVFKNIFIQTNDYLKKNVSDKKDLDQNGILKIENIVSIL
jgi:hypothetical protein